MYDKYYIRDKIIRYLFKNMEKTTEFEEYLDRNPNYPLEYFNLVIKTQKELDEIKSSIEGISTDRLIDFYERLNDFN